MNYIVSGHGGRWDDPTDRVTIPKGFTIHFFVRDGEPLSNENAWPIYNHLLAGDEASVKSKIVHSVFEGGETHNYSCWNYPELKWNSGIFKVGVISTSDPIVDLSKYAESNPLTLKEMFKILEPGEFYWVACKIISEN